MLMAALLITDELMDARAALAEKGEAKTKPAAQANGQAGSQAAADQREQDAIRSEHRRRAAAGGDV